MTTDHPVTKRDLADALRGMDDRMQRMETRFDKRMDEMEARMQKMVGQVVGEIVGEALQLISNRFDKIEARLDSIEDKLEATIATIEHHTIDIRQLKRKIAQS